MNIDRIVEAVRTINRIHNLSDAVYAVRDREENVRSLAKGQSSWEGPLVVEYSAALKVLSAEGVL